MKKDIEILQVIDIPHSIEILACDENNKVSDIISYMQDPDIINIEVFKNNTIILKISNYYYIAYIEFMKRWWNIANAIYRDFAKSASMDVSKSFDVHIKLFKYVFKYNDITGEYYRDSVHLISIFPNSSKPVSEIITKYNSTTIAVELLGFSMKLPYDTIETPKLVDAQLIKQIERMAE